MKVLCINKVGWIHDIKGTVEKGPAYGDTCHVFNTETWMDRLYYALEEWKGNSYLSTEFIPIEEIDREEKIYQIQKQPDENLCSQQLEKRHAT